MFLILIYLLNKANQQPSASDCLECRVFACFTDGLEDRCLLLWLTDGNLILEEKVFESTFNNFKNIAPFLLWIRGTFKPTDASVMNVVDCSDVASLDNRNSVAISDALALLQSQSSINVQQESNLSSDVSILTALSGVVEEGPTRLFAVANSVLADLGTTDKDGDEVITVHTAFMPERVLEEERKLVGFLSQLYANTTKVLSREIDVGGNIVTLRTFHYPPSNMVAPRNGKQKTFIDATDMPLLFSYEFKAALIIVLKQVLYINLSFKLLLHQLAWYLLFIQANKRFASRAFLSYCQLVYMPESMEDKMFEKYQLILIGVLTTLCVSARNDFLILDTLLNKVILWNSGMQFMKNCYCNRAIPIDKAMLKSKRDEFFSINRWWYDPSRGISRNHQNPGNYDVKYKSSDHLNETAKWSAIAGKFVPPPPAAVTTTSELSASAGIVPSFYK